MRSSQGFLVILLLFLFATLPACMAETEPAHTPGESLYRSHCSLCHGVDGHAKTTLGQQLKAADLHSEQVQENSNALLKQVILHGKGTMPPFEGQLTDAQIEQLLKYVRQFGKKGKN